MPPRIICQQAPASLALRSSSPRASGLLSKSRRRRGFGAAAARGAPAGPVGPVGPVGLKACPGLSPNPAPAPAPPGKRRRAATPGGESGCRARQSHPPSAMNRALAPRDELMAPLENRKTDPTLALLPGKRPPARAGV